MTEHNEAYTTQAQTQGEQNRARARLREMKRATEDVLEELDLPSGSKYAVMSMMFKYSLPIEETFVKKAAGADERLVVEEMIRGQHSEHWEECRKFVKLCVNAKAKNIPVDLHEDIAQEAIYKITKSLPHFRFQCALKTWMNLIIEHCIIDAHRRLQNAVRSYSLLIDQSSESTHGGEIFATREEESAEEAFMINDEIRNGWAALLEYAKTHSNPIRDQLIIWMVIREGKTHADAAIAVGCSAPVVGYVVREAQRYAREKMGHKL